MKFVNYCLTFSAITMLIGLSAFTGYLAGPDKVVEKEVVVDKIVEKIVTVTVDKIVEKEVKREYDRSRSAVIFKDGTIEEFVSDKEFTKIKAAKETEFAYVIRLRYDKGDNYIEHQFYFLLPEGGTVITFPVTGVNVQYEIETFWAPEKTLPADPTPDDPGPADDEF